MPLQDMFSAHGRFEDPRRGSWNPALVRKDSQSFPPVVKLLGFEEHDFRVTVTVYFLLVENEGCYTRTASRS